MRLFFAFRFGSVAHGTAAGPDPRLVFAIFCKFTKNRTFHASFRKLHEKSRKKRAKPAHKMHTIFPGCPKFCKGGGYQKI